jgi:hypothetical protein
MSPVKYELGLFIPEDDILHSHSREKFESYLKGIVFLSPMFHICNLIRNFLIDL